MTTIDASSSPLFDFSAPTASEVRRLVELARGVLDGDDLEQHTHDAWDALELAPRRALSRVLAGELPLVALSVLAGLTGVVRPKDYGVRPFWNIAFELANPTEEYTGDGPLLTDEERHEIAEHERTRGARSAKNVREALEALARENVERYGERKREWDAFIEEQLAGKTEREAARDRGILEETAKSADILYFASLRHGRRRATTTAVEAYMRPRPPVEELPWDPGCARSTCGAVVPGPESRVDELLQCNAGPISTRPT